MKKIVRRRGKQLSTLEILEQKVNSPQLRKDLKEFKDLSYINFCLKVCELRILKDKK